MMDVKYPGIAVFMDGKEYIVPSLSLRQFKEHCEILTKDLGEFNNVNFLARIEECLPVIQAALSRNYPALSLDDLRDMLDLSTFPKVLKAIAAASGMREVTPGEAVPVAVQ